MFKIAPAYTGEDETANKFGSIARTDWNFKSSQQKEKKKVEQGNGWLKIKDFMVIELEEGRRFCLPLQLPSGPHLWPL